MTEASFLFFIDCFATVNIFLSFNLSYACFLEIYTACFEDFLAFLSCNLASSNMLLYHSLNVSFLSSNAFPTPSSHHHASIIGILSADLYVISRAGSLLKKYSSPPSYVHPPVPTPNTLPHSVLHIHIVHANLHIRLHPPPHDHSNHP